MIYPFDPTTLPTPGATDMPEPYAFAEKMAIREVQAEIIADQADTYLGAHTTQYGIDDYQPSTGFGRLYFSEATSRLVCTDLAESMHAAYGAYPTPSPLKPDPDAYWFIGQLRPDPAENLEPVNAATVQFYDRFFELLKFYNYEFVNSVAYEILDFFMPPSWKQLNWKGDPAQSGWFPPSSFIQPTNHEPLDYIARVQIQILQLAVDRGIAPRFQIGEPWWWDGSYNTGAGKNAPCLYDPLTMAMYEAETGNAVPTPWITNIFDPVDEAQWPYVDWLCGKLGASTNYIRDAVKVAFPDALATLLFFTPQIMSPSSELTGRLNFPTTYWQTPNYDFVQIEDYDWIIDGRLDLVPLTFDAATERLGYPRDVVHYFVGFILNAWDYQIWPWIDKAIRMAKDAGMLNIYIWSYTQAMRDSIVYDDLPPDAMSVPIFEIPPDWSDGYRVTREFKTEIITSRGGKEQRRALRQSPRRTVEYTSLLTGSDMRKFDAFLATWQGYSFYMAEIVSRVPTATAMAAGAYAVDLEYIPPWLQLGTVALMTNGSKTVALVVERITGNTVEFAANTDDWPVGSLLYRSQYGAFASEISTRRLNDRVTEAAVTFNINPGSEPPPWHPTVAPVTFDGVEMLDKQPDWSEPVSAAISRVLEQIDYGKGRTKTFQPQPFTNRLSKFTYLNRSIAEAEAMDGFFQRMKGQQGVFWSPTWLADLEIDSATVPGDTLYVKGREVVDFLLNDSVLRNIAIITEGGVVEPYKIMSIAAASDDRTAITVTPPINADVLDRLDKISWLILSRLGSDALTETWHTDSVASFELTVKSLQNTER